MKNRYIELIINDPRYRFSPEGVVETTVPPKGSGCVPWRLLPVNIDKEGYYRINYQRKKLKLHRVIYRVFNGQLKHSFVINHIDGKPSNNSSSNLEQITHRQNIIHSFKTNDRRKLAASGKKNTQDIVDEIRREYSIGFTSYRKLAKKHSLAYSTIAAIVTYKSWSNLVY